jgi:Cu(I)/Ag(I) efflux system protein CusF
VTIAHEPIAALSWPAMTMAFKVAQPDLLKDVAVGSKVEFMLHGKDMSAVITSLKKVE